MTPWEGITPRRWQAEAYDAVREALRARKRPIVAAATGSGKAYLLAEIVRGVLARSEDAVVVAAPRIRLVEQLSETIASRVEGVGCFYGEEKDITARVVVACNASIPKLAQELRRPVRMLLVDEAHRSETDEIIAAVRAMNPRFLAGCTATPFRSNPGESLSMFDSIAYRYTIDQGIADGVLVRYRDHIDWYRGEGEPDVEALTIDWIRGKAAGPGLVSANNIDDADAFAGVLNAAGIAARSVHSRHPKAYVRDAISWAIADVSQLRCLVHVNLLSEGVDIPPLRWLVQRRKQRSPIEVVQEVGRILRAHPSKTHASIFDPHAFLARRGLSVAEALGAALDGDLEAIGPKPRKPRKPPQPVPMPPATAVSELDGWCSAMLLAMASAGMPVKHPNRPVAVDVTSAQRQRLKSGEKFIRYMPKAVREPLRALLDPQVVMGLSAWSAELILAAMMAADAASAKFRTAYSHGQLIPYRAPVIDIPVLPTEAILGIRARVEEPRFDWNAAERRAG
jgi:hypothetical protein